MELLRQIDSPKDLKRLKIKELEQLAQEIRDYMISVVSEKGGHLGGNLGAVELEIALHYVFDSPKDKIIFDVGHQAYPHKILTGRRDLLPTIRKYGGISGFLRRDESEHDIFGAGHASTSLSAALGIAIARDRLGQNFHVIAVIGDGGLTGGMAYEALNNIGQLKPDMIIVLNDNEMSIAENVGAISDYLAKLKTSPFYHRIKDDVWELLGRLPSKSLTHRARILARKIRESLENLMVPTILFEEMGIHYIGPINGHDLKSLIYHLNQIKRLHGPVLLHTITVKGKGYPPAEKNQEVFHGLGPFEPESGEPIKKQGPPSYTEVFGKTLLRIAKKDYRVIGITAAMPSGTGLKFLKREIPEQFFDVGIAEQHAVTFAAGLATQGMKPFAAIYSTFLQRAFDQIIHDVALQNLPVRFALDRAGLVGADGPTHHGAFDLSYLRLIPNMVVMAPKDEAELVHMVYTAYKYDRGPIAFRYPRGSGYGVALPKTMHQIPIGSWETIKEGKDAYILAVGSMVYPALEASRELQEFGLEIGVVNARFIKPMDIATIKNLLKRGIKRFVTIEENVLTGGFGAGVLELFESIGVNTSVLRLGLPDYFVEHGDRKILLSQIGLDLDGIINQIKDFIKRTSHVV